MPQTVHAAPLAGSPVLIVGAGLMGAGIAQVAAEAGHPVILHDLRAGAAAAARDGIARALAALVAKGRREPAAVEATLARIVPADTLDAGADLAAVRLVVEAIVEQLPAKQALLRDLEARVGADCILATNTSSISVTAIARGLRQPERVVGMHFFNPVPAMKLVEVVSGLATAPAVADAVFALAGAWGKTAVHARSTPGFIVNRIARPYYAEALALLQVRAATPAAIDACLRGAGFRMGPCELMDLIGHDTNLAVTESVHAANYFDRRYVPSRLQREMVDGGWLGRKSGRGFYSYPEGAAAAPAPAMPEAPAPPADAPLCVHGRGPVAERWRAALAAAGRDATARPASDWTGLEIGAAALRLALTDGRTAARLGPGWALHDELPVDPGGTLAWSVAPQAQDAVAQAVPGWLGLLGVRPQQVGDAPGLVVARTLAMLVNEAADAVEEGVCSEDGADAAMTLGLNWPAGPFAWRARLGAARVVALLEALDAQCRGERYRVNPALRALAQWPVAAPA